MVFVESVTSFLRRGDTLLRITPKESTSPTSLDMRVVARAREDLYRPTGYHNTFGLEPDSHPPSYQELISAPSAALEDCEALPGYTSTVNLKGDVELRLEGTTPFNAIENAAWHHVHAVLRGTLLSIHACRPGTSSRTSTASKLTRSDSGRGRLLRKYTMQHAEVGLASDHPKSIAVPKPIVQYIPGVSLEFLRETEPQLFDVKRQYVIRIRVEGQQLLFRVADAEAREAWINALCTSIDIADPLDERAEPQYQTLPRRRRGHRSRVDAPNLEEQQQICREQFPHLLDEEAARVNHNPMRLGEPRTQAMGTAPATPREANLETQRRRDTIHVVDTEPQLLGIEQQELDTSFTLPDLEQAFERRLNYLNNLFQNVNRFFDQDQPNAEAIEDGSDAVLDSAADTSDLKWDSNLSIDPLREARYKRRCMPSLLFNSRYASTFVVRDGLRLEVNWAERKLKTINPQPPTYDEYEQLPPAEPQRTSRCRHEAFEEVDDRAYSRHTSPIPIYLRSTTLPVPSGKEGLEAHTEHVQQQHDAPLLTAWKELKGWTQSVRAMAIGEDVRPSTFIKRPLITIPKGQSQGGIENRTLHGLAVPFADILASMEDQIRG